MREMIRHLPEYLEGNRRGTPPVLQCLTHLLRGVLCLEDQEQSDRSGLDLKCASMT